MTWRQGKTEWRYLHDVSSKGSKISFIPQYWANSKYAVYRWIIKTGISWAFVQYIPTGDKTRYLDQGSVYGTYTVHNLMLLKWKNVFANIPKE